MLNRSRLAISLAFWLLALALPGLAEERAMDEYQMKGAFLLNFARFVDWPLQAFRGPESPIVICILGPNPFGLEFARAARGLVVEHRPVSLRAEIDVRAATDCHMVFVGAAERKRMRELLQAVQHGHVLTVGESTGFVAGGGVIGFRIEADRVRMEISTEAAERAGLRISAKLLSLAQAGKRNP